MEYRIIAVSSREVVWEGIALNPRYARKQADALLGRRFDLPKYITLDEREDYVWNGVDKPIAGQRVYEKVLWDGSITKEGRI